MDLIVEPTGILTFDGRQRRCALGRGGVTRDKREGDGATPVGAWALRRVLYRPDRVAAPHCVLPGTALESADGWCDDPGDAFYNRHVTLPHPGRCEPLWRDDHLYDVIVVLGYNDAPPVAGRGSAIFLHVARPDYGPTEGCVALAPSDLIDVLGNLQTESRVVIRGIVCS